LKWKHLIPFGLAERQKPRHFREMLKVAWENKHALPFAWRILKHGVCDGCSLGPYGLKDNVMKGTHLCLTRLKLLGLNTRRGLDPDLLPEINELRKMSNEALHSLGRVPVPMQWRKGERRFKPMTWDKALSRVSQAMATARDRTGMFATSRGLTNETYYVFRKLASLVGTNNVDLCARLCHAASVDGLKEALGVGAPTCSLSDLIGTDLVVIFGSNLANNQPVTMKYLHYAKQKGTKIVVVNPYREPGLERYWVPSVARSAIFGTKLMDDFFQVSTGGDIAFVYGVLKALDAYGGFDRTFVESHTRGFAELKDHLDSLAWSELENHSGVTREQMVRFARIYAEAKSAVFVYSMGLTQHRFGVDNVKAIANLALSRGMLGREKCGIMPIRGHSGVQGGGECGVDPGKLPGGFPITPENVERFENLWSAKVASHPGLKVGQMLEAAHEGSISVLYSIGGNLFETMPDPDYMKEAIARVPLRIHQDLVLNTSTLLEGEEVLVLPAQTRYEQRGGGTSTSTERRIRFTPEIPGPRVGESKAEWEIVCEIGRRIPGLEKAFAFESSAAIREEMGKVMPIYAGIEQLQNEGDQIQWGGPTLFSNGFDKMPDRKARFLTPPLPDTDIPDGMFYVSTRRGKQFNSMTYGKHDPLTHRNRNDILISRADATMLGFKDGDPAVLRNDMGEFNGRIRVSSLRPKNIQVFWPEGNVLISRRYDPVSGEPDYNSFARLERMNRTANNPKSRTP
jgi:molybdopterin-dependent oxidoreductase alpha subunit